MPFTVIPLDGGLDLQTAPQAAVPGTLIDCQNYEVALQKGYRRIDGYEKFDGGQGPNLAGVKAYLFTKPHLGDTYTIGQSITFTGGLFQVIGFGTLAYYTIAANTDSLYVIFTNPSFAESLVLGSAYTINSSLYTYGGIVQIPISSVSGFLSNQQTFYSNISATIQPVPGQGPVNGLFWLKNQLYATRDYFSASFTTGNAQPNIGDVLYQGASLGAATWSGTVAAIVLSSGSWNETNNAAGTIMFYNTSGTISNAVVNNNTQSASSVLTVSNSGTAVTALGAGLYVATGQRGATTSTQSWQWCDLGQNIQFDNGVVTIPSMNFQSSSSTLLSQAQATSWHTASTPTSGNAQWTVNGGTYPSVLGDGSDTTYVYNSFSAGSVAHSPGTLQLTGFGFTDADIPNNSSIVGIEVDVRKAIATPGTYSVVDKTLKLVGVSAYANNGPNIADLTTPWATTATDVFYGAPTTVANVPTNILGYTGITVSDVKNTGFGLNFTCQLAGGVTANQATTPKVYNVQMRVSYVPLNNCIYFWNPATVSDGAMTSGSPTLTCATSTPFTSSMVGYTVVVAGAGAAGANLTATITSIVSPSAVTLSQNAGTTVSAHSVTYGLPVKAQVVQTYKDSGDWSTSNAHGTLYFQVVQSDGTVGGVPIRPIGANEQIRSYPNNAAIPDGGSLDGSTLFASTNSVNALNSMDWGALLTGRTLADGSPYPASKYQSVTKNFYANSGMEAIYGVSGGGPAFYFDGVKMDSTGAITGPGNFCRILTGLTHDQETPRSIEAHQGHIFLGYYSGLVQWSDSDNVLSFDPTLGNRDAGEEGFSDHVTAIKSIQGDALGVWTTKTFQMIQGQIDNPSGVYTSIISPTSGGIEYTVQPMETYMYADFRGVTSIATTNAYGDFQLYHLSQKVASFLTPRLQNSSFIESGSGGVINSVLARAKNQYRLFFNDGYYLTATLIDPQNPVPQYTIGKYTLGNTQVTWDVIISVTDNNGRDRIFGSSAASAGVVYELDRGNSFSGNAIPAYITLVPDVSQAPFQNKRYSGFGVYGIAQDYATFQMSRSNNYVLPTQATGANVIQETFGASTAAVTGNNNYFQSIGTSAIQLEGQALTLRFDSGSGTDPGATTPQFSHVLQAVSYNVTPAQAVTQ